MRISKLNILKEHIETAEQNGISCGLLRARVRRGMPLEEAMTKPNTHKKKTVLDQFLEQEFSIVQRDIAKENGISDEELRRRVLEGWSSEDIVTIPEESQKVRETKPVIAMEEITGFASRIGLSYGQVESYLNMGKTFEEIEKLYGAKKITVPHRWAKKENVEMGRPRKEEKTEMGEREFFQTQTEDTQKQEEAEKKTILRREDVQVRYRSENFSYTVNGEEGSITIQQEKNRHLKIEQSLVKELSEALAEIAR